MKKFILKNAMALVALAIAAVTLMSFGLEKKTATTLYFTYEPGDIPDPYSQENVEDLDHWIPAEEPCPTTGNVAACTIEVDSENTIGETELNPLKVKLNAIEGSSSGIYIMDVPLSIGKGYANPVNRSIL